MTFRYSIIATLLVCTSVFSSCSKYESLLEGYADSHDGGKNGFDDGIGDGEEHPEADPPDRHNEDEDECSYSTGGMLQWAFRAGSPKDDMVYGLAIGPNGSFYITGRYRDDAVFGNTDGIEIRAPIAPLANLYIAKYKIDGSLEWVKWAGNDEEGVRGSVVGRSISVFPDGSTVVAGEFTVTVIFGKDEENETTLSVENSYYQQDMFVAKYDPEGKLLWARSDGDGEDGFEHARAVAATSDGSSIVAGWIDGSPTFGKGEPNETTLSSTGNDVFIARYQADGMLSWVKTAGGPGGQTTKSIALLADGTFLICGSFADTVTFGSGEPNETSFTAIRYSDMFIAKYAPDGTLVWARSEGGLGYEACYDISSLHDGSFLITGQFDGASTFGSGGENETTLTAADNDLFLARYNPDGTLVWARNDGGGRVLRGYAISAYEDGSCVVLGGVYEQATFGLGEPCETTITSAFAMDTFVSRYNPDGTLAWVRSVAGDGGEEYERDIVALPDGSSIATGYFYDRATFGPGEENETTLTTPTERDWDIFVMRLGP